MAGVFIFIRSSNISIFSCNLVARLFVDQFFSLLPVLQQWLTVHLHSKCHQSRSVPLLLNVRPESLSAIDADVLLSLGARSSRQDLSSWG